MLITVLWSGCGIEEPDTAKVKDLEYTIEGEEDLPEELRTSIEGKKAADCKMVYEDNEYLYIMRGYGEQETGGYSIQVKNLYLTSNAVIFSTDLIGPSKGDTINTSPSYPYIVLKTELLDKNVIFE